MSSVVWFVCPLCLQQLKSAQAQFIFVSFNAEKAENRRPQLMRGENIKARFNNGVFLETVHECNIMSPTNAVLTGRIWLRH